MDSKKVQPKITSFFKKKGEKIKNAHCKIKAHYGAVCDKILTKSMLPY